MILKDLFKGKMIEVKFGDDVIQAVIDEDTEFRVIDEDGNPLDPNEYVVYEKEARFYVVPAILELSDTEYYDFREERIKRKN